jgi:hypothetical protein
MKRTLIALVALSLCAMAHARFEIPTPESKKAAAAWERKLRRDFDFARLHDFLLRMIAEQKRFEGVDLESSAVGDKWRVNYSDRILSCGSWMFRRDEKGTGFQLRHYPGEGDREVMLVCERESRRSFRLIEVRWGSVTLFLARDEEPNQALQPTRMLVTFRALARPAPSTRVADL